MYSGYIHKAMMDITGWDVGERRERARKVLRYLVEEAGLPVSDWALERVAEDAGSLATCREARRGPSSLQILARRAV